MTILKSQARRYWDQMVSIEEQRPAEAARLQALKDDVVTKDKELVATQTRCNQLLGHGLDDLAIAGDDKSKIAQA